MSVPKTVITKEASDCPIFGIPKAFIKQAADW